MFGEIWFRREGSECGMRVLRLAVWCSKDAKFYLSV